MPPLAQASNEQEAQSTHLGASAEPITDPRFSVVIPLNNEEENVHPLLTELDAVLSQIGPYELIVVDDGSTDSTGAELRRFASTGKSFRLLTHESRRGQSTAVCNGIRSATSEFVVVLDGDLQNDPADIPPLLEQFGKSDDRDRLGLVIGNRVTRRDSGLRRLSSRIANGVRARMLNDGTPDTGCGLKIVRRSVFMRLPYFDHMHRFLPALIQSAGYQVCSLPVGHRPRVHGKPHYGVWNRLWIGIIDMFGVAWLSRRAMTHDYREERL